MPTACSTIASISSGSTIGFTALDSTGAGCTAGGGGEDLGGMVVVGGLTGDLIGDTCCLGVGLMSRVTSSTTSGESSCNSSRSFSYGGATRPYGCIRLAGDCAVGSGPGNVSG